MNKNIIELHDINDINKLTNNLKELLITLENDENKCMKLNNENINTNGRCGK